jgi:hypothetical protein
MRKAKLSSLGSGDDIERTMKEAEEILRSWAKDGSCILLSIGASGVAVEGTIRRLDHEEPRFWFTSISGEVTTFIFLDPPLAIERRPDNRVALRFGPERNQRYSLRLSPVQKPNPAALAEVVSQLNIWVRQKAKLMVQFDFGFASSGHLCEIEAATGEIYGFTECGNNQTCVAIPSMCRRLAVRKIDGITMVSLSSEDGQFDLCIAEASVVSQGTMGFAISKTVH